ncbi:hypothetical protein MNBD_GAMMA07-625 [hydrothermal vent metagenome]|uniref:Uncharacterized protein n=1 Tax=hydrothermal vent metagenome TaxID=652676 RepID=A0A3B0WMY1_9ZZZZ
MASVFELAKLSEMTYDSTKVVYRDWYKKLHYGPLSGLGFYAEYYFNHKKRDVVLAIRGTDLGGEEADRSDILSDVQIMLGHSPSQLESAKQAYAEIKRLANREFFGKYNFYLTGHSLGGGLATILSARHGGKPTVTFNAPSVMRSFIGGYLFNNIGSYHLARLNAENILHIRASGDMVSWLNGRHIGKVEDIYVNHWGDSKMLGASRHLAQHSIKNIVDTLSSSYVHLKELGWKSLA